MRCLVCLLFLYFDMHYWLPCYLHLTRVSIRYSVCIPQGTSKRSKFSWMLYWHIWSVQESLHKCWVAPLLARCCFTVLSNHESQGSRGVTTVCLVYTRGSRKGNKCHRSTDTDRREDVTCLPVVPVWAATRGWEHLPEEQFSSAEVEIPLAVLTFQGIECSARKIFSAWTNLPWTVDQLSPVRHVHTHTHTHTQRQMTPQGTTSLATLSRVGQWAQLAASNIQVVVLNPDTS